MPIPQVTTQPIPIKELNRYFWIDSGVMMEAPMYEDGAMRKNGSRQVTRPDPSELSAINNRLGLRLTVQDFPSRRIKN